MDTHSDTSVSGLTETKVMGRWGSEGVCVRSLPPLFEVAQGSKRQDAALYVQHQMTKEAMAGKQMGMIVPHME